MIGLRRHAGGLLVRQDHGPGRPRLVVPPPVAAPPPRHRRRWSAARPDLRRALQLALGLVWILDAALQYQPYMFSAGFARDALAPTAQGNPALVAGAVTWVAGVTGRYAVVCNALFATVQLVIGIGLLVRRTVKPALALSIVWALSVWWLGEGLGGVLTGASPLAGAPGAVILYACLAILVWPTVRQPVAGGTVAESGLAGRLGARVGWVVLWSGLASLFVLPPANRAPDATASTIAGMGVGEPAPLGRIANDLGRLLAGQGLAVAVGAAVACALVAASVFAPAAARRAGIGLALAVGATVWLAENFGAMFTGRATDPNSGLLLVFVAVAFWPLRARRPRCAVRTCPATPAGLSSATGRSPKAPAARPP